jgi:hypothetical protein
MKLHEYLESLDEKGRDAFYDRLADLIKQRSKRKRQAPTRPVYIGQLAANLSKPDLANEARRPGHKLAQDIHKASKRKVPLHELRPDIWSA